MKGKRKQKKRVREGAPGCKAPLLLLSAGLELRLEESRRAFPVIEGLSGPIVAVESYFLLGSVKKYEMDRIKRIAGEISPIL